MQKFLKIVATNLLIMLVLLTIADPFFKTKNQETTKRCVMIKELPPNIDFEKTPPDRYMVKTQNLEQQPYRVRTDKNGFITSKKPTRNTDNVDIMFFGGSTTECMYVEEDKRFPFLTGELLSEKLGRKISVINAGVGGGHSFHSTINLLAKGLPLQPKTVVWMHNINDLVSLSKTGTYHSGPDTRTLVHTHTHTGKFDAKVSRRFKAFAQSGRDLLIPNIYRRTCQAVQKNPADINLDEWESYRKAKSYNYEIIEKQFEQSLLSFINVARSHDINVVLMTQFNRLNPEDDFIRKTYGTNPNNQAINYDNFCKYYKNLNIKIKEIATQENVFLIDLVNEIPQDSLYIYDPVHLNTQGSELAAKIISEHLFKLNIK